MSDITTLAQNIVFTAWDWPKTVVAKNGVGTLRDALASKRFVSALLDCTYLGLKVAWSRADEGAAEPITNFVAPVLLKVDQVIEAASVGRTPIHIEDLERAARRLRSMVPDFKVDPGLVEAVTQFARTYSPAPAAPARESNGAFPA